MIDILIEYGIFLAKSVTIVVSCLLVIGGVFSLLFKGKDQKRDRIQVKSLNKKYEGFAQTIKRATLPKQLLKESRKKEREAEKRRKKRWKKSLKPEKRVFVLDFDGDIQASAVDGLREEVTAVLTVATPQDEVLLRLNSGGGLVHTYGLAASQLMRIRRREIPLVVSIDKIAASGGYLMASVAERIIAAPFAVVGSIGVVAQLPNFNRLLRKHDIDFEQLTAGEHKRTLTLFGENTDKDREKLRQDLEETHELFKGFLRQGRRELDMEKVATGEHWYGTRALELKLVDELMTSDDYLLSKSEQADLFELTYLTKKSIWEGFPFKIKESVVRYLNH